MKTINSYEFAGSFIGDVFARMVNLAVKNKEHHLMEFNGHIISTKMSLDEVFKTVTGLEYEEWVEDRRKEHEKYVQEEDEWKNSYKEKATEFVETAKPYISTDLHDELARIAEARFSDIYHGYDMQCMLDIVKLWEEEGDMQKCRKMFQDQGHSGWSAGIVMKLVKKFCDEELGDYIYKFD